MVLKTSLSLLLLIFDIMKSIWHDELDWIDGRKNKAFSTKKVRKYEGRNHHRVTETLKIYKICFQKSKHSNVFLHSVFQLSIPRHARTRDKPERKIHLILINFLMPFIFHIVHTRCVYYHWEILNIFCIFPMRESNAWKASDCLRCGWHIQNKSHFEHLTLWVLHSMG